MPKVLKQCVICGKDYWVKPYKKDTAKYCSRECLAKSKMKREDSKWITKTCPSCGKLFDSLISKNKKYCSPECNALRLENTLDPYECDYCGKEFVPDKMSWKKYLQGKQRSLACSRDCANQLKKKGTLVPCVNCGKMIYRTPYRIELRENQFCSYECEFEYHHSNAYEDRFCEICGKSFTCARISKQRFCSIQCQGRWQSTQTGLLNPRSKRTVMPCDYCGNEVLVPDYKFEIQEHFFCNEKCRQKWFAEFWSQTDEWHEKSVKRAVKILEDGLIPFVFTKPQLAINTVLDEMNIEYKNDYGITYFSIDNYLIDSGLMIEVMGDYWHSNPLKFDSERLNDVQRKRIPRDKAKHTYAKNTYNVEILYLWESDILEDINKCKCLVNAYISTGGVLNNYHSFNYKIYNNQLVFNKIIDMPY